MLDILNTAIQAFIIAFMINYFIKIDTGKSDIKKVLGVGLCIFISTVIVFTSVKNNSLTSNLIAALSLFIIFSFYREHKFFKRSIIGFASIYLPIQIISFILLNINVFLFEMYGFHINMISFIPLCIVLELILLLNKNHLYKIYKYLLSKKSGMYIGIVLSFSINVLSYLCTMVLGWESTFSIYTLMISYLSITLITIKIVNIKDYRLEKAVKEKELLNNEYIINTKYNKYLCENYSHIENLSCFIDIIKNNEKIEKVFVVNKNKCFLIKLFISNNFVPKLSIFLDETNCDNNIYLSQDYIYRVVKEVINALENILRDNSFLNIKTFFNISGDYCVSIEFNESIDPRDMEFFMKNISSHKKYKIHTSENSTEIKLQFKVNEFNNNIDKKEIKTFA